MKQIKFSKCPFGKHEGETWDKLKGRDISSPAILYKIKYKWSRNIPLHLIKSDTFSDFTQEDFLEILNVFYKTKDVYLAILHFEHPDGDFTTMRAYDWKHDGYYKKSIGEEFLVVDR